jgi:hypothetical protein
MSVHRFAAAALGAFAAATAVPLGLAQLDFADIVTFLGIDHGDTPAGVLALAGVSGIATLVLSAVALAGAALALTEARSSRTRARGRGGRGPLQRDDLVDPAGRAARCRGVHPARERGRESAGRGVRTRPGRGYTGPASPT